MKMVSMNAYSKDLRLKVLSAIDRGIPRKEVSDLFGVSLSTIKRRSHSQDTTDNRPDDAPGYALVDRDALMATTSTR
jgi:hypothetical protein